MFEFDWSLRLMVLCVFCDSSPAHRQDDRSADGCMNLGIVGTSGI